MLKTCLVHSLICVSPQDKTKTDVNMTFEAAVKQAGRSICSLSVSQMRF